MKVQESRENYLEAILILTQRNGFVRSIDVANFMDLDPGRESVPGVRTALWPRQIVKPSATQICG